MTTFDIIILQCPHCNTLMTDYELMSYTVHKSTNWSDGKSDIGQPTNSGICICPDCQRAFWKYDARYTDEMDYELRDELPGSMDLWDLDWRFDDDRSLKKIAWYKDLLKEGFDDEGEKEMHVRTMIWWSINDLVRKLSGWRSARNIRQLSMILDHRRKSKAWFKDQENLFNENLDRLIFLYIKNGDPDLLFIAEMYRERGNFKKAMEVFNKAEDPHLKYYRTIKKLIRRKKKVVVEL